MLGFGWAAHRLSTRGKQKKCPRCDLRYPETKNKCPHCDGLDPFELQQLKNKIQQASQSNRSLGKIFLFATVLLVAVMVAFTFY